MFPASKAGLAALGERFRTHTDGAADRLTLQEYREYRCAQMADIFCQLAEVIDGSPAVLSCRVKRIDTIIRKLQRQQEMALPRMDDILGFRIVSDSYALQHELAARVAEHVDIKRTRDYTRDPAASGYRAIHMAIAQQSTVPGTEAVHTYTCELQIRTYYQNIWGTVSEGFGEQVKEGGGTTEERAYLLELSHLIRHFSENNPHRIQAEGIRPAMGSAFFVVHYDKNKNSLIRTDPFGKDIEGALEHVTYLENLHRQDLGRETVLLGAPDLHELEVTHLRYFRPPAAPDLPDFLVPARPRPDALQAP